MLTPTFAFQKRLAARQIAPYSRSRKGIACPASVQKFLITPGKEFDAFLEMTTGSAAAEFKVPRQITAGALDALTADSARATYLR